MPIVVKDVNNIPQLKATVRKINSTKAGVGYITGGDYAGGKITNKGLARVHEYGVNIFVTDKMRRFLSAVLDLHLKRSTTHIHIPERSFLRNGSKKAKPRLVAKTRTTIVPTLLGERSAHSLYEELGEELRDEIQTYARALMSPSNHPKTIEQKGFNNPLIETGGMIEAIEVIVE